MRRFAVSLALFWLSLSQSAIAQTPASTPSAPPLSVPVTRIAIGSCADEEKPQPIWDAVLAYKPDLFIFAGDNVYGDSEGGKPVVGDDAKLIEALTQSYALAAKIPGMAKLRETVPHLATWDDHDYGKNDAGAEFAGKQAAQKQFVQFWNIPATDPRASRDGVYHAQTYGNPGQQVQVIVLDTRFFRSDLKPTDVKGAAGKERYLPDDTPGKTMLGEAQWTWLADRLREPADLRIIVSSIQVLADGHGWERWGNLPLERKKLYDLIAETKAEGVVMVSGDRHISALYTQSEGTPYPLYELTASGLTQYFATNTEAGPNRLGTVYGRQSFGTIDIDWWAGELTLSVRDEAGQHVRSQKVGLPALKMPAKPASAG
jgi:alkaline phosphatase D